MPIVQCDGSKCTCPMTLKITVQTAQNHQTFSICFFKMVPLCQIEKSFFRFNPLHLRFRFPRLNDASFSSSAFNFLCWSIAIWHLRQSLEHALWMSMQIVIVCSLKASLVKRLFISPTSLEANSHLTH
jgi:hypothetical protein